jgi:hypothetical protein
VSNQFAGGLFKAEPGLLRLGELTGGERLRVRWRPVDGGGGSGSSPASTGGGWLKLYVVRRWTGDGRRAWVESKAADMRAFVAGHRAVEVGQRGEVLAQLMALLNERAARNSGGGANGSGGGDEAMGWAWSVAHELAFSREELLRYPLLDPTHAPLPWLRYELCQLRLLSAVVGRALPLFDLHLRLRALHKSAAPGAAAWKRPREPYPLSLLLPIRHLLPTALKLDFLASVSRQSRRKRGSKKVIVKRRFEPSKGTQRTHDTRHTTRTRTTHTRARAEELFHSSPTASPVSCVCGVCVVCVVYRAAYGGHGVPSALCRPPAHGLRQVAQHRRQRAPLDRRLPGNGSSSPSLFSPAHIC